MTRSKKCVAPAHGPKRKRGSVLKIPCCYIKCSQKNVDCKNRSHELPVSKLNKKLSRRMHPLAKVARFCSAQHQRLCTRADRGPYGGREALSTEQIVCLFDVLRQHTPWAAVLFLLGLVLGERVDAARQCRLSWFRGLDQADGALPTISIPRCNGKTKARQDMPLHAGFAKLLHGWIWLCPLQGHSGKQWPHLDQPVPATTGKRLPGMLLFPGRQLGGTNKRNVSAAISPKAFWNCFKAAQKILGQQRKEQHAQAQAHPFDDIDLDRITSHSCKKSAVTMLSEHTTTAIVSAITATSPRVLDSTYVCPTKRRQREAVDRAFSPVVRQLAVQAPDEGSRPVAGKFCVHCGGKQLTAEWLHCPSCGTKYTA